jgi:hypothetical protein
VAEGRVLGVALLAVVTATAPVAAETLRGVVSGVTGTSIEVLVDGPRRPAPGDRVRVVMRPWAGDAVVVGSWRIEAVEGARARAVAVGPVGPTWPGQTAEIDSPAPRESPAAAAPDAWLDRLRAEASAIGPPKPAPELPSADVAAPGAGTSAGAGSPTPSSGAGSPAGAGVALTEAEPNDVPARATPMAPGAIVTGTIQPRNDADHYRVEVTRGGEFHIAFTGSPPELDMAVQVLAADGKVVVPWRSAPGPGRLFETFADLPAPGAYVLEVRDGHNTAQSVSPYRFVTRFTPVADPAEPNDAVTQATPLAPGAVVRAHILPRNDADHYRIEAGRRGELHVRFPLAPPEVDVAVQVLTADGRPVHGWRAAPGPGQLFETRFDLPEPGPYVLEVRDAYNNARSAHPYELVASFTPVVDPAEPNDTIARATPLALGQPIAAQILPRGDADHYRVEVPGAGRLHIHFEASPPEVDMAVQVLTAAGAVVRGWQSARAPGAPAEFAVDVPRGGPYVLEVRDAYNNERSIAPYRLRVGFTAR